MPSYIPKITICFAILLLSLPELANSIGFSFREPCYQAFMKSSISLSSLPFDNAVMSYPMGSQICTDGHSSCIQLESPLGTILQKSQSASPTISRLTPMQAQTQVTAYKPQQFILKNLLKKPLSSISPATINDHWQLYEASVASFNALRRYIAEHKGSELSEAEQAETNAKLAYEYAVIVLHELFFMNTNASAAPPSPHLQEYIEKHYGRSLSGLVEDLISLGSNDAGIGWICALMDYETGNIVLGFLNGNDISAIGNLHPLLVVDCWEHAFVRDFGISGRREYVTKYATEIDWKMMEKRLDGGLKIINKRKREGKA